MAHIDELVERMTPRPGVTYLGVALNDRGRDRLRAHVPPLSVEERTPRIDDHLCDVFVERNYNRTCDQVRATWPVIVEKALAAGCTEGAVGLHAAWGSNWRGRFDHSQRMAAIDELAATWERAGVAVAEVALFDPMGWNMPHWVAEDVHALRSRYPTIERFRIHLHNQRGMACASLYAAIDALDESHSLFVESCLGGLGGCPYCGNGRAAGMVPTEDFVQLLQTMGLYEHVDLYGLCEAAALTEEIIGRPLAGHVSKAGPLPAGERLYPIDLPLVETHLHAQHWRLGPEVCAGLPRPWLTG
jgi:hydroxymethylglutaryl-CoA lyase